MVVHKALLQCGSKYELEQSLPEWTCRGLPIFPGSKFINHFSYKATSELVGMSPTPPLAC